MSQGSYIETENILYLQLSQVKEEERTRLGETGAIHIVFFLLDPVQHSYHAESKVECLAKKEICNRYSFNYF